MNGQSGRVTTVPAARCSGFDIHSMQVEQMKAQSFQETGYKFGRSGGGASVGAIPATSAAVSTGQGSHMSLVDYNFYDKSVLLDSVFRDQASSDLPNGLITWQVSPINNQQDLSNVIAARIGSFYIPNIQAAGGKPSPLYYSRVYVQIVDMPVSGSTTAQNSNAFHFEMTIENLTGQAVELKPIDRTVYFPRPITSLSQVQLRFMTGPNFTRLPLPADTFFAQSVVVAGFGTNPIRFTVPSSAAIGLVGALVPGVAVFITGYQSNDPAVNVQVNDPAGVYVTNVIDATTIEIAGINALTVNAVFVAQIMVPKNRIAPVMRFTSTSEQQTNGISVSHD